MKTFNFVYKTSFDNGFYYYGQHKTNKLDDGYYGSNNVVKDLVKNHTELNPKREILRYCKTQKELNYWERYYIGDNWKNDTNCLNKTNYSGQPEHVWNEGINFDCNSTRFTGHKHSEESKRKMSESHKGIESPNKGKSTWNKGIHTGIVTNGFNGHKHSEETKRKMSESHKGRTPWNKGLKKGVDF